MSCSSAPATTRSVLASYRTASSLATSATFNTCSSHPPRYAWWTARAAGQTFSFCSFAAPIVCSSARRCAFRTLATSCSSSAHISSIGRGAVGMSSSSRKPSRRSCESDASITRRIESIWNCERPLNTTSRPCTLTNSPVSNSSFKRSTLSSTRATSSPVASCSMTATNSPPRPMRIDFSVQRKNPQPAALADRLPIGGKRMRKAYQLRIADCGLWIVDLRRFGDSCRPNPRRLLCWLLHECHADEDDGHRDDGTGAEGFIEQQCAENDRNERVDVRVDRNRRNRQILQRVDVGDEPAD